MVEGIMGIEDVKAIQAMLEAINKAIAQNSRSKTPQIFYLTDVKSKKPACWMDRRSEVRLESPVKICELRADEFGIIELVNRQSELPDQLLRFLTDLRSLMDFQVKNAIAFRTRNRLKPNVVRSYAFMKSNNQETLIGKFDYFKNPRLRLKTRDW